MLPVGTALLEMHRAVFLPYLFSLAVVKMANVPYNYIFLFWSCIASFDSFYFHLGVLQDELKFV